MNFASFLLGAFAGFLIALLLTYLVSRLYLLKPR